MTARKWNKKRHGHRRGGVLFALATVIVACAASLTSVGGTVAVAAIKAPQDPALTTLIAAAKKEGSVTVWMTHLEDENARLADAFKAKYGITVNHPPRQSGPVFPLRFVTERNNGSSDMDVAVSTSVVAWDAAVKAGYLQPINATTVPGIADFPAEWIIDKYSLTWSVFPQTVCYNTNQIKGKDLKTWQDVLLGHGSKLMIIDPHADAYWTTYNVLLQTYGIDFLKKVGAEKPSLILSAPAAVTQLTSGEVSIIVMCVHVSVAAAEAAGAPIAEKTIYPVSGVQFYTQLAKGSPHPNAAKLFVSWLASKEGQIIANRDKVGSSPLIPAGSKQDNIDPMPVATKKGYVPADVRAAEPNMPQIFAALGVTP